ncbi:MAG: chemotaxis protein CheX [Acidobacteriota bacterium]
MIQPKYWPGQIVAAIHLATTDVFSTMLSMLITGAETQAAKSVGTLPATGLISLVGLTGPWVGTGTIACTVDCACKLSSQFLMTDFHEVNDEVLDAMAELTNMIIGNVKNALETKVGAMGLSTPTVICGQGFRTRGALSNEWTGIRFNSGEHELFVQLCLVPSPESTTNKMRAGFQIPNLN